MSNFHVAWHLDDDEATTAEQAAATALATMQQATVDDQDSATVFTVIDSHRDEVHTVDLSDPDSGFNSHYAVWPRPTGTRHESRLNATDAKYLANQDGDITLVVRVDQTNYLCAHATIMGAPGTDDHFDLLHETAFSEGLTYGSAAEIIGVSGSDFLVRYTTNIEGFN